MDSWSLLLVNEAKGVERDVRKSRELCERIILEGVSWPSMCNLAKMLERGEWGAEVDPILAKELYEQAIAL